MKKKPNTTTKIEDKTIESWQILLLFSGLFIAITTTVLTIVAELDTNMRQAAFEVCPEGTKKVDWRYLEGTEFIKIKCDETVLENIFIKREICRETDEWGECNKWGVNLDLYHRDYEKV